jgi:hypothetical protein
MNDEWKVYFSDRLMKTTHTGIKLIKPADIETEISAGCSTCGFFMRGMEDMLTGEKYGCCQECAYKWAEPNRVKWEKGWRPTKNEIQKHTKSIMNQPTFRVR